MLEGSALSSGVPRLRERHFEWKKSRKMKNLSLKIRLELDGAHNLLDLDDREHKLSVKE